MNAPNQFAATFLQEAAEQLALIEDIILEIEHNPSDIEAVNRLFRIFHTIKGSGAMFGFDAASSFTHHVETVLDQVRSGSLAISRQLIDLVLASKDQITDLLQNPADADPLSAHCSQSLIAQLQSLLPGATPPAIPTPPNPQPVATPSNNPDAPTYLIQFRPEPGILARGLNPANLLADLRSLGSTSISARTDLVASLADFTPDVCGFRWEITLATNRGLNAIKDVFIFVEEDSQISIQLSPPTLAASTLPPPAASTRSSPSRAPNATDGSVRVPAERLNRLVNLVGELVINQSRLAQVARRLDAPDLASSTEDFERLVAELRDIVLGIRMMPIGGTFNRFKRLVRDLSAELGKEIDLATQGEDTELDKTVIDQLGDPLVHLIRNAIDHGIESPNDRVLAGKSPRGTVRLAAQHSGSNVVITIDDDGRGIDHDAVRSKALERGLIGPDTTLSDGEILDLIFLPGFSTASTITSVSGRGVGMDVVKRHFDTLRGQVHLASTPGRGTRVTLTLPLTLAIIDGLLVEIDHDPFIVPMSLVTENVELSRADRSRNNGRNTLPIRGELIPYLRLREAFAIHGTEPDIEKVVIVRHGEARVGLVVDRVLGSHQTVIQTLGRFYRGIRLASGCTIMGDGRVALILDPAGLIQHVAAGASPDFVSVATCTN